MTTTITIKTERLIEVDDIDALPAALSALIDEFGVTRVVDELVPVVRTRGTTILRQLGHLMGWQDLLGAAVEVAAEAGRQRRNQPVDQASEAPF